MAKKKIEMDGASKVVDVPEPLKRKCEIKQVLPVSVIQLLAAAPANETIRNVLLAHLRVPVPAELVTYKDIQDWIEFNIDPPKSPLAKSGAPGRERERVSVLLVATDRERGSCSYAEDLRGRGHMSLDRAVIEDIAQNSDDSEEFFSRIRDEFADMGVRDHIALNTVEGSESYSDHEVDDSDGIEIEIQREGGDALKQALREINPEEYERLFE